MKKNSLIKIISVVIIISTLFSGCSQTVTDDANTESNYGTQVESTTCDEFEKDGYSLLMNGVYVDNLPGTYLNGLKEALEKYGPV